MMSGKHATGAERAHPVGSGASDSRALVRRQLGSAIRRRRHAASLTLATVSERAGISVSMLSQVERGLLDPSLDTLRNIADALGTAPFRLLAEEGPIAGLVRRAERKVGDGDSGGPRVERLSPSAEGAFAITVWELPPGTSKPGDPRPDPGEEANLLLAGSAQLEIGDDLIDLAAGDCVTFDPRVPHRVTVVGDKPATCLVITCPPAP
jgi:transcriptional regulator with XRE-family HTH domain